MSLNVLGISSQFHDSAAALVVDGNIVAAAQEERFTRRKGEARWPSAAIAYCLSQLPSGASHDIVAYYEDPALKVSRILDTARTLAPRGAPLWPQMTTTLKELSEDLPRHLLSVAGCAEKVVFVPHHRSHAAAAFYPSPCDRAAVLVLDGVGEYATTTIWRGDTDDLIPCGEIRFPHSLGLFYSAFTQYCGFKVNSGEYKLMGLAPFGTPRLRQVILDNLIDLRPDGSFALDMAYFDFDRRPSTISPLFERLFGQPVRHPDEAITAFHMNLAASAQAVLEEAVLRLARTALARTGERNLCLAGGVALNCLANRRLRLELAGLETLWIQPAAGDAGGALGAALEVSATRGPRAGGPRRSRGDRMQHALLGPSFGTKAIRAALDKAGLVYDEVADPGAFAGQVAETLAAGQIVAHFDGPMEFGPRALGNRSILADPRSRDTLQRVNRRIKFREDWRPFAPMVLADRAAALFEHPAVSPYMLLVADLKPSFRGPTDLASARAAGWSEPLELQEAVTSDFSAVTHVDFSARLQTIEPGQGSRAGRILEAFAALTGCPMLLNTSFNVRGEPIVCSPSDAVACFLNTHLDALAIGPFLVSRAAQPDGASQSIGRSKFGSD